MNAIDSYNKAKQELEKFLRWKSLIGKEYYGGTSGKGGEFGRIHSTLFTCEIYHQESDGAKNYHDSQELPESCKLALSSSAKEFAQSIIDNAEARLRESVKKAARMAEAIAAEIIAEAKLD